MDVEWNKNLDEAPKGVDLLVYVSPGSYITIAIKKCVGTDCFWEEPANPHFNSLQDVTHWARLPRRPGK